MKANDNTIMILIMITRNININVNDVMIFNDINDIILIQYVIIY